MKKIITFFLALCSVCSVLSGCTSQNLLSSSESSSEEESSSQESSGVEDFTFVDEYFNSVEEYDTSKILKGLEKMGIDSSYKIVMLDTDELVVNTAAENLQEYLKNVGINCEIIKTSEIGTKQIILAFNGTSDTQAKLFSDNAFEVCSVDEENDAFNMKQVGDNIIIAGSNPRSVLYGVYELEEHLMYKQDEKIDTYVTWAFKKRSCTMGFYWSGRDYIDEKYFDEKAEYLSRLGMNTYSGAADDTYIPTMLSSFVHSDTFPYQKEPQEIYKQQLKAISAACKKYGIDYYQWLTEPALPYLITEAEDMKQYPEEALGSTEIPSWITINAEDLGKTICIHSELGQKNMTEMIQKFIQEYPDVAGAFIYNNDSNSFLCVPEKCEYCKKIITSNTASINNWKMFSDAINIYAKAAHSVNPKFRIMVLPAVHNNYSELLNILANTEIDDIAIGFDAGDHAPMVTAASAYPEARVERCIKFAKQNKNVECYIYHAFSRNESVPQNFMFLVSEAISIKQFYMQGFEAVMDSGGPTPECNSMNPILLKEMLRDPTQDYNALIKRICIEQLGNEAGKLTYDAAMHIGEALEVWSEAKYSPFRGSIGFMGIGSMLNEMTQGIIPSVKSYVESYYHVPSLDDEFFSNYKATESNLKAATDLLGQAVETAREDQYIKYAYYTDPEVSRPNCKQYAELQYATTILGRYYAEFQVNRIKAWKLLCNVNDFEKVKNGISDGSEAFSQYVELIKSECVAQKEFVNILNEFLENNNYIVAVSQTPEEIQQFIKTAKTKISEYEAYLAKLN